jgi:hypothetical protein
MKPRFTQRLALLLTLFMALPGLGDIVIGGKLAPSSPSDTYAIVDAERLKGGFLTTTNHANLPSERLVAGQTYAAENTNGTPTLWFYNNSSTWIPAYLATNDIQGYLGAWTNLVAPLASPTFTGTITAGSGGLSFPDGSTSQTAPRSYYLTFSGWTATLAASSIIWADGTETTFSSQSVGLYTNATQYIGIDVFDQTLHNYPRALDMGTKWIAQVVTGSSGVTSIKYLTQNREAPAHRFEGIKQKLIGGTNIIKVAIIGDSISGPYPGYTTNWVQALFNQSSWAPAAYISHTANWYVTNYAVGTQTPLMGMAMIGSQVESPVGGQDNALGGNFGYADPYYSDMITGGGCYSSPVLDGQPDLLIVGYYNPTPNFLPWLERIVQRARARGIAVILHDDNPDFNVSATQYFERGPAERQMANQHGAMYIDTSARSYEYHVLYANTPTMNADSGLHPNDLGQQLFAKWFRAALAPNAQKTDYIPASPTMVNLPSGTYSQVTWPWNFELEFALSNAANSGVYNTNIAYADVTQFNKANPAIIVGNRSTSTGALAVPTGSYVNFTHPCALYIALMVDGNSAFNWTLAQGSTTVASGTFGGVGARTHILELASVDTLRAVGSSAYNHGVPDYWVNAGWRLNVTSGTAVVYGAVIGVPPRKPLPLYDLEYYGSWDTTNSFGANWQNSSSSSTFKTNSLIPARATDTTGNYVKIPFVGSGVQVLLESGIAAGQFNVFLDGRQITTLNGNTANPLEGYLGASRVIPINVMAQGVAPGDANVFSTTPHVLKVIQTGVGSSASSTTPANMLRRFKLLGVSVIGSPDWIR